MVEQKASLFLQCHALQNSKDQSPLLLVCDLKLLKNHWLVRKKNRHVVQSIVTTHTQTKQKKAWQAVFDTGTSLPHYLKVQYGPPNHKNCLGELWSIRTHSVYWVHENHGIVIGKTKCGFVFLWVVSKTYRTRAKPNLPNTPRYIISELHVGTDLGCLDE